MDNSEEVKLLYYLANKMPLYFLYMCIPRKNDVNCDLDRIHSEVK